MMMGRALVNRELLDYALQNEISKHNTSEYSFFKSSEDESLISQLMETLRSGSLKVSVK